jgi:hypothetical protein
MWARLVRLASGLTPFALGRLSCWSSRESETKSGRVPLPSGLICQYQPEKGMPKMGCPKSAGSVGVGAPSSVLEATRLVR